MTGAAALGAFAALPAKAIGIFDDPANASGLGAPAILRGTVSTQNLSGLVIGAGQTTGVRQANATALQNAINYCAANGKFFEIVPGIYEINSAAGLVIPVCNGFVWRGEMYQSSIVQFYNGGTGAPILTMGDAVGSVSSGGWEFEGIDLSYGVNQTGLTSSQALIAGNLVQCRISNISILNKVATPYNGFVWSAALGNFSNVYNNIVIFGVQNHFMTDTVAGVSTGNILDNIYLNNGGTGTANQISGNYINLSGTTNDWDFRRLNCEWGKCQFVIKAQNQIGLHFSSLHIEGITLGAAGGSTFRSFVFNVSTASIDIDVLNIVDLVCTTANVQSGSGGLIEDFIGGSSVVKIGSLTWVNNNANQISGGFQFYYPTTGTIDDATTFIIDAGYLRDATQTPVFQGGNQVFFDNNMPLAAFRTPNKFGRYDYGVGASSVTHAQIPVSATYTHYGQHSGATILVPASITGFTLTLAATIGATGNDPVPTGTITRVHRSSGSVSGTLLVKDDAGTTLSTNVTSGVDLFYRFIVPHYVAFTPEPG